MIDTTKYKSGKRRPLMFNIRLLKKRGKPTAQDVVTVLEFMLANQRVPTGWKFAAINWRDPRTASTNWRTGSLRETFAEEGLGKVIEVALASARISIVRKSGSPTTVDDVDDDEDLGDDE